MKQGMLFCYDAVRILSFCCFLWQCMVAVAVSACFCKQRVHLPTILPLTRKKSLSHALAAGDTICPHFLAFLAAADKWLSH